MLSNEVNTLKKDIQSECINDKNVYDTKDIEGTECCKIHIDYLEKDSYYNKKYERTIDLFIPIDKMNTKDNFYPLDEENDVIDNFDCSFVNSEIIKITSVNRYYYFDDGEKELLVKLPIKSEKDTFKEITSRTKENYIKSCNELIEKIDDAVKKSEEDLKNQKEKIASPFVAECYMDIILKSSNDYIADFKSKRIEVELKKNKVEQCQTIKN